MIVLHLLWHNDRFWFWGEGPARTPPVSTRSPFDIGMPALVRILHTHLWSAEDLDAGEEIPLLLPTRDAQPFSSYAQTPPPDTPLTAWRVNAIAPSTKNLLMFFGANHQRRLAPGLFLGDDILWCMTLFHFTGMRITRGAYLPDLICTNDNIWRAVWSPTTGTVDVERGIKKLSTRMPTVVAPSQSRSTSVRAMFAWMLDAFIRTSLTTTLSIMQYNRATYFSIHDTWLAALRNPDSVIYWDSDEIVAFADDLRTWRRSLDASLSVRRALCFTMVAPSSTEDLWQLHITCPHNADGRAEAETLIALGQAAMIFPALKYADYTVGSDTLCCSMTRDDAHAFLLDTAPLLTAAGYATVIPEAIVRDAPRAVTLEAELLSHATDTPPTPDETISVAWHAQINGESVSKAELDFLLAQNSPFVYFRGHWIELDRAALLEVAKMHGLVKDVPARDVIRMALGLAEGKHAAITGVRACGWLRSLLNQLSDNERFSVFSAPASFRGTLRPYQQRGYSWLVFMRQWGFGACLADDMGLGKTIQTLAFLAHIREQGTSRPTLLVCPMSVMDNWAREINRFTPTLTAIIHHGDARWRGASFVSATRNVALVVTSYALLQRDHATLRRINWANVILDEAQCIKNPDTRQARAARMIDADYRIALTGTPMENNVGEIWALMQFLNPGLLGDRTAFRDTFFRPIQTHADTHTRQRLKRVITPFILRRLKTDRTIITDLPEKIETSVYCPLTHEQTRLYEEVMNTFHDTLPDVDGTQRRGMIFAVLTHLKQICNHPANYLGETGPLQNRSGKLTRLEALLETIFARGESALIFTQYATMGRLLQTHLADTFGHVMPFLHGGLSRAARDAEVAAFQNGTTPEAFILSLKAGGFGLNLTRATHIIHYDRWWNPAVENQATDRAFRIGQTQRVTVHKFMCGGTLEDRIDMLLHEKAALLADVVGNGERFLTEMGDRELEQVLALAPTTTQEEDER